MTTGGATNSDLYFCNTTTYVAANSSGTADAVYARSATVSDCSSVTVATCGTHTTWGVDCAAIGDTTTDVSYHVYYPNKYRQTNFDCDGSSVTTTVTAWATTGTVVTSEQARVIINGIELPLADGAIIEEHGTITVAPDGHLTFRDFYFRGSGEFEINESTWRQGRYEESEEQKKAREFRESLRNAAEIKAKDLLKDFIGKKELEVYNETGRLYVKGKKNEYIVRKDRTVQLIEKDKIVDLCIHLKNRANFPATDNVVALKFMIEHEEDKVLKLANRVGTESLPEELPLAACM